MDRLGLLSNAWAAVRQGAVEPTALLDALPSFDGETNRLVVAQLAVVLRGIDHALVENDDRAAFHRYVAARLAGKKAALGWEPTKGAREDDDRALVRRTVLETLGRVARDPRTLAEAEAWTRKWLKDPSSVPGDVASVAVPMASLAAGPERVDELRAAARDARTPEDLVIAMDALGSFADPAAQRKALDLTLTDEVRVGNLRNVYRAARERPDGAPVLFAWEKEHWAQLVRRLPGTHQTTVSVAGELCTKADRDDARAFFPDAARELEGVKRPLDEGLEAASLCVALREHGAAAVDRYFRKPAPPGAPPRKSP